MTRRQYSARWLTRRCIKGPTLGDRARLANILVGPIRNMRLSTDGVCIKLLTLLKSRVLHAKSLCPFGLGGSPAVPTGNQIRAARMMQCFCLTRRTQTGSNFRKRQASADDFVWLTAKANEVANNVRLRQKCSPWRRGLAFWLSRTSTLVLADPSWLTVLNQGDPWPPREWPVS
jgi:hypothetical protein